MSKYIPKEKFLVLRLTFKQGNKVIISRHVFRSTRFLNEQTKLCSNPEIAMRILPW